MYLCLIELMCMHMSVQCRRRPSLCVSPLMCCLDCLLCLGDWRHRHHHAYGERDSTHRAIHGEVPRDFACRVCVRLCQCRCQCQCECALASVCCRLVGEGGNRCRPGKKGMLLTTPIHMNHLKRHSSASVPFHPTRVGARCPPAAASLVSCAVFQWWLPLN